MSQEHDEYTLGQDVTAQAAASSKKSTAVLSVRLPVEDIAEIESVSRATGKSLSQLVREAVGTYLHFNKQGQYAVTVSIEGGATVSTGQTRQASRAAWAETRTPGVVPA